MVQVRGHLNGWFPLAELKGPEMVADFVIDKIDVFCHWVEGMDAMTAGVVDEVAKS